MVGHPGLSPPPAFWNPGKKSWFFDEMLCVVPCVFVSLTTCACALSLLYAMHLPTYICKCVCIMDTLPRTPKHCPHRVSSSTVTCSVAAPPQIAHIFSLFSPTTTTTSSHTYTPNRKTSQRRWVGSAARNRLPTTRKPPS